MTPPRGSVGIVCQSGPLVKEKEEPMQTHTVVGVDIAKAVFEIAVSHEPAG